MKKIVSVLITILVILWSSSSVYAVDGYKDLLFGSQKSDILSKPGYSFVRSQIDQPGVEFYVCQNFKFGDRFVEAGALFVEDKFLRFIIEVPVEQARAVVDGLKSKYGPVSSSSSQAAFEAVDVYPNSEAFLAFDGDTVYFKLSSDNNKKQSAILIYTSPAYDQFLLATEQQGVANDL